MLIFVIYCVRMVYISDIRYLYRYLVKRYLSRIGQLQASQLICLHALSAWDPLQKIAETPRSLFIILPLYAELTEFHSTPFSVQNIFYCYHRFFQLVTVHTESQVLTCLLYTSTKTLFEFSQFCAFCCVHADSNILQYILYEYSILYQKYRNS